jgi:cell division protein FtsB
VKTLASLLAPANQKGRRTPVFRSKKVGLLGRIALILILAYMIYALISVRQEISAAKAEVDLLTEQLAEQEQYNTELSNAIENRDNPDFVEDIAREKLGLVSPHDRVFYITD